MRPDNTCDWCDRAAVVSVNGLRSCEQHLDHLFNLALTPVRALMRSYRGRR